MSVLFYTVTVPTVATSLATLITALPGRPTMTIAGRTVTFPAGTAAQLTLTSDPANAGKIYVGNSNVTAAGTAISPGAMLTLGDSSTLILTLSNIFVIAPTASTLGIAIVN